jgi:hypothetical protein
MSRDGKNVKIAVVGLNIGRFIPRFDPNAPQQDYPV